jgi:hypothetical protein
VETWPSSKLREQRSNSRSAGGSKNPLSPLSPVARTGQFWINAYLIAHITTPHFLYFEADCRRLHVKNRRLQVRPLLGGATPGKKKSNVNLFCKNADTKYSLTEDYRFDPCRATQAISPGLSQSPL